MPASPGQLIYLPTLSAAFSADARRLRIKVPQNPPAALLLQFRTVRRKKRAAMAADCAFFKLNLTCRDRAAFTPALCPT